MCFLIRVSQPFCRTGYQHYQLLKSTRSFRIFKNEDLQMAVTFFTRHCTFSSTAILETKLKANSDIEDKKTHLGHSEIYEFDAEKNQLLDIVVHSLYSEREVFVRELISNASDALEKFRLLSLVDESETLARELKIDLTTDKYKQQFVISDNGVGMTKDELVKNFGTIAQSGTKAFAKALKQTDTSNIIGQFGVGFYSAFMVANKIEVLTRSYKTGSSGYCWTCDGMADYKIQEASNVDYGTKIQIHLKPECRNYADEDHVKSVLSKYSNFVGFPIYINGQLANKVEPVWVLNPKKVSKNQYISFYQYITNTTDIPRFVLHYKTEVPLNLSAVLYFPTRRPAKYELSLEFDTGVALYSHRVLIQSKAPNLLPKWLRFIKGIVDSEDVPLNLSRELLQKGNLLSKLHDMLTMRVIKFLRERSVKEPYAYGKFYEDYKIFIKEGISETNSTSKKESIANLMRFETSKLKKGISISLEDYCTSMAKDQTEIYYLFAPNRVIAESSPLLENMKKQNKEVLFCYDNHDELILILLGTFKGKRIMSLEKNMGQNVQSTDEICKNLGSNALNESDLHDLLLWTQRLLKRKVFDVTVTNKLDSCPCIIIMHDSAAAHHFLNSSRKDESAQKLYELLRPQFAINPCHPIIKKLSKLKNSDSDLAEMLVEQLYMNSMCAAHLAGDPRNISVSLNQLLIKVLDKC